MKKLLIRIIDWQLERISMKDEHEILDYPKAEFVNRWNALMSIRRWIEHSIDSPDLDDIPF